MADNLNKKKTDKGLGRILFTGYDRKMIDNVVDFIGHGYKIEKCAPTLSELTAALKNFRPHVVIICVINETAEKMNQYGVLCDDPKYVELPVIAIGYDEDCNRLKTRLMVKNLELFSRPLDHGKLLETIAKGVERMKKEVLWSEELDDLKLLSKVDEDSILDEQAEERSLIRKIQGVSLFHGRKCILVVDDDVQMLNVIKLYLQDLYDVTVVPSGKLALKFISKKATDLVLLDYMMPEMDGPAVLQQIRENSNYPDVPVIFLTGVSDKEKVMRTLEFRPNGYLLKPVSRKVLIERVTEILLDI